LKGNILQASSAIEIGENLRNQIIKTEIIELNQFMENHRAEFRLIILDRIYKIDIPIQDANPESSQAIWTELFSTFLADYNRGLAKKEKFTATP
jgi:hypothetical protein